MPKPLRLMPALPSCKAVMPLSALICVLALASCGPVAPRLVPVPPDPAPPVLAQDRCSGWNGPVPSVEKDVLAAVVAERKGRLCEKARADALVQIIGGPR